jgi:hypothetical protein
MAASMVSSIVLFYLFECMDRCVFAKQKMRALSFYTDFFAFSTQNFV